MPKFVKELAKYKEFKHCKYHYDRPHGHNTMNKRISNFSTVLESTGEKILTSVTTLVNHSNVVSKQIELARVGKEEELDRNFQKYYG